MKKNTFFLIIILILIGGCGSVTPKKVEKKKVISKKVVRRRKKIEPKGSKTILSKKVGEKKIKAIKGRKLENIKIENVYPLTVKENTLMSISGENFGLTPAAIKIGEIEVIEFLQWENNIIWLKTPKGIKDGDKVKIGNTMSDFKIKLASEDAIKVIWEIDLEKIGNLMKEKYKRYELLKTPEFKLPIYLKGQWIKKKSGFGNYASNWDVGSKSLMYNVKGTKKWISECYFTEANFKRFKRKLIYFAFEDSNIEQRRLSQFESDAAFMLKNMWAITDEIEDSDSDPGLKVSKIFNLFNKEDRTIYINFPREEHLKKLKNIEMEENNKNENYIPEDTNFEDEDRNDEKIIIYQMMTRLFGNSSDGNKKNGTIEENGVGKFNDITEKALVSLKKMGISHIWYTGVIEHATMTDYTKKGIKLDDADVVKGRAGSPYAIKDYYDVDPDLAENVDERMEEFQKLIERTHKMGLKAIIDFVPNHVARSYKSDKKPENVKDLGVDDDNSKFDPNNNFYYIVGEKFEVPEYNPLNELIGPNEDSKYDENPAKVTGNDVFSSKPKKYDWFETVKLNYGLDINGDNKTYFNPIPSTWIKMRDILKYWTEKGVDGFRCDMAEMVPYEFWGWVIPEIKKINPKVIFIAEIYNIGEYKRYINEGKFDYLYDKVGMYDYLRLLTQGIGSVNDLEGILKNEKGISSKMLKFLENHDEQRLASDNFAGDMWAGLPAMVISSTISTSPVMIYFGQEVGEKGKGDEGFNGEDGRTTIFDYWGVPEHQKWMNDKKFDGEKLSSEQKKLRKFYSKLLNITSQKEAIKNGDFYQIYYANRKEESEGWSDRKNYAYFRWNKQQKILIVLNFDRENEMKTFVKIPEKAFEKIGLNKNKKYIAKELLWENEKIEFEYLGVSNQDDKKSGIPIEIAPMSAKIFEIIEK